MYELIHQTPIGESKQLMLNNKKRKQKQKQKQKKFFISKRTKD